MHTSFARMRFGTRAAGLSMKIASVKMTSVLIAVMTVAAGATVLLSFQTWVDFGITELSGTDAEAATGVGDGWVVAALASAIILLVGGVIFTQRQRLAPVLLPLIAIAAVAILAIAGFDTITNWHASGVQADNPGILVQSDGDPTIVPYAIAALAILIAVLAAITRAIEMREDPHLFGELVEHEAQAPDAVAEG
jgi:hypothetical protein